MKRRNGWVTKEHTVLGGVREALGMKRKWLGNKKHTVLSGGKEVLGVKLGEMVW